MGNSAISAISEKMEGAGLASAPLDYRCLALTGSFGTNSYVPECFAEIGGDFNGRGLSLGVLQWDFESGSLQPLLKDMMERHNVRVKAIFQDNYEVLEEALGSDKNGLLAFARSIQDEQVHLIFHSWRNMFRTLCCTEEFQQIQREHSAGAYAEALFLCSEYGLWSERAVAMLFDIVVQNGGIDRETKSKILKEIDVLPQYITEEGTEVRRMEIIANIRADAATYRWIEDIRARKLCCANGKGIVHGVRYDLEAQYGIGLRRP